MAKAILVMDMPDGCADCPLDDGEYEICNGIVGVDCPASEIAKYRCTYDSKPDWCPLIPEPERIDLDKAVGRMQLAGYAGWNACLDVLEGKENE